MLDAQISTEHLAVHTYIVAKPLKLLSLQLSQITTLGRPKNPTQKATEKAAKKAKPSRFFVARKESLIRPRQLERKCWAQ